MLNIFLTDLAAYNSGALVGKWVKLPLSEEELRITLKDVLLEGEVAVDGNRHEEYFITDFDWDEIDIYEVEEYEDIFDLNEKLELLQDLDTPKLKAVKFILDNQFSYDIEEAIFKADDVIIHEEQSIKDLAYDILDDCYDVQSLPDIIKYNIDYEQVATYLEDDGTYFEVNNDVFEYIG